MICGRSPRAGARPAGFTLLEMVIALSVLLLLFGSIAQSMGSMQRLQTTGSTGSRLQREAERALDRVIEDLRLAGRVEVPGVGLYPHVFQGGVPAAGFPQEHAHDLAPKTAIVGDPDFGLDEGLLLLLPQDFDGDGNPDINMLDNTLLWSLGAEVSYTRQSQPDGRNVLMRTVTGEAPRVVARDLEWLEFTPGNAVNLDVPLGCVRVRLFFRAISDTGVTQRARAEATVRMRNTPDEFIQS
jgi:prepilin-type N-terminal cleavage/methylation domain-containing protein